MPKTLTKALQNRLLRSPGFRRMLADAHLISGVECLFLDELGTERIRLPRDSRQPLRQLERQVPEVGHERIRSRQRVLAGDPMPHAPWVELARPLMMQDECIGYWVMSGWRNLTLTEEEERNFWIGWARDGADLSWPEWSAVLETMPGCDTEKREAWIRQMEIWERQLMAVLHKETGVLPRPDKLPPAVLRACDYIREHFPDPLTLKEVARFCGISPEYLSRLFHQSTGLRFREYLAETRVDWVCRQLENNQDPIGVLAHGAGFSTLSRFNRTFRLVTGMTPSQWRRHRLLQKNITVSPSYTRSGQ